MAHEVPLVVFVILIDFQGSLLEARSGPARVGDLDTMFLTGLIMGK